MICENYETQLQMAIVLLSYNVVDADILNHVNLSRLKKNAIFII